MNVIHWTSFFSLFPVIGRRTWLNRRGQEKVEIMKEGDENITSTTTWPHYSSTLSQESKYWRVRKKNTYPIKARGKSVLAAKRQWYELLNSEIFWRYYWKFLFETCVIYPPYQAMKSSLRKVTVMIKLKFNWGKVVIKGIFHSPSFNKCLSNIFPCPLLFYRVPQP